MDEIAKSRSRRKLQIASSVSLVVATLAAVGWISFQPRNDPRLLTPIRGNMVLIPRSKFNAKPWIKIPPLKIEYPAPVKMPPNWTDNPASSGALTWIPKPGGATGFEAAEFYYLNWIGPDNRTHLIPNASDVLWGTTYFDMPYVFGSKPVRFGIKLTTTDPFFTPRKTEDFDILIPPTGKPAPTLQSGTATFGSCKLLFEPVSWIGPTFGARYRLSAKGLKPDQELFIRNIMNPSYAKGQLPVRVRLKEGDSVLIHVGPKLHLTVNEVVMRVRTLKAQRVAFKRGSVVADVYLHDEKGKLITNGTEMTGNFYYFNRFDPKSKIIAMIRNGEWVAAYYNPPEDMPRSYHRKLAKPILTGPFKVTTFESVRSENITLDNLLPEAASLFPKKR